MLARGQGLLLLRLRRLLAVDRAGAERAHPSLLQLLLGLGRLGVCAGVGGVIPWRERHRYYRRVGSGQCNAPRPPAGTRRRRTAPPCSLF